MLFIEEYVSEQMVDGVKKLGEGVGVSQEVVKIVMNVSVYKRQGIEWVAE